MESSYWQRHPLIKDGLGIVVFILAVLIGTLFINAFIFRSFNVLGPSMEKTLYTGDRLIVNRLPVTWDQLRNKEYVPERGQVIVFKNPQYNPSDDDEFIVKRVIAFPGERVTVKDGVLMVYNKKNPKGFNPDTKNRRPDGSGPGQPTSGDVDTIVADSSLFVSGDHREGSFSYDSRSGLGLIPYYDIIGPVALRIYPFTDIRSF